MPRATWKGFLKLSLVSCPVFLSPATTRAKAVPLRQVWVPSALSRAEPIEDDPDEPDAPAAPRLDSAHDAPTAAAHAQAPGEFAPATAIALRPHDPYTGELIDRDEVRKAYEYEHGQFVTFTPDELKALDVESSKSIDLATFVPRAEVDPIYFDTPYYLYPDGAVAAEPYRVISAAMAETGMAGLGRLTLSRRERMVLVEPRGTGMMLVTLRAASQVRAADFDRYAGEIDAEAVAIGAMIIKRKIGVFDPTTFRDRYQEALRELVAAKLKNDRINKIITIKPTR